MPEQVLIVSRRYRPPFLNYRGNPGGVNIYPPSPQWDAGYKTKYIQLPSFGDFDFCHVFLSVLVSEFDWGLLAPPPPTPTIAKLSGDSHLIVGEI